MNPLGLSLLHPETLIGKAWQMTLLLTSPTSGPMLIFHRRLLIPTAEMFHGLNTRVIGCQASVSPPSLPWWIKCVCLADFALIELFLKAVSLTVSEVTRFDMLFVSAEPHPSNVERHRQETVGVFFYDRRHQQLCITQQRYSPPPSRPLPISSWGTPQ